MADIASVLKAEIARIARKEVRAQTLAFKKASALHRSGIASLRKQIDTLERQLKNQQKSASRPTRTSEAVPDEGLRLRFRAGGFASLRKKFDISAADMGKLLGVTGQSVYAWEAGKSRPRAGQLKAIAAVRKLGKREVTARLQAG